MRLALCDAGEFNGRSVGKPHDEREADAQDLDRPAQRREQVAAVVLRPRVGVLAYAKLAGNTLLRNLTGLAQFPERHLLGDEAADISSTM